MLNLKIIIASSEAEFSDSLVQLLKRIGYHDCIVHYPNKDLIGQIETQSPDIIIIHFEDFTDQDLPILEEIKLNHLSKTLFIASKAGDPFIQKIIIGHPISLILKPVLEQPLRANIYALLYKKEMELRIKENERRFNDITNNTKDWIWEMDSDGRYTYASPVVEKVIGYRQEEVLGRYFFDFFHNDEKEQLKNAMFAILSLREAFQGFVTQNIKKDDSLVILEMSGVPIMDANHSLLGYRGANRDVTEQNKWEERIRQSEHRFKLLFNNVFDAIIMSDDKGNILDTNKAATRLLHFTKEEMQHLSLFDIHKDQELLQKSIDNILNQESDYIGETELQNKYKQTIIAEIGGVFFKTEDQVYLVTSYRDITERKKVEEKLKLSDKVFENTLEGIIVTDAQENILSVNPAFTSIYGYFPEEVRGKHLSFLRSNKHKNDFITTIEASIENYGQWMGEIWHVRKDGEEFPLWLTISAIYDENGKINQLVSVFNDITELKEKEDQIRHQAYHDPLTDLPNRLLFNDRLKLEIAHSKRYQKMIGVLFLDLDRFKNINDNLGHGAGDLLLKQVAERISTHIREGDTVARMGGDEFTLIISEIAKPEDAAIISQRILHEIKKPYMIEGKKLYITASIGICIFPNDGEDEKTLTKNADMAMYRAKEEGRDNYQFFTVDLNIRAQKRLSLENDLRNAVKNMDFLLYYQPRINVKLNRITGVEALLRWNHPVKGLIYPKEFLHLAEETGLILPISEYVLYQACKNNKNWQSQGLPSVPISVNISALQIQQKNLAEMITNILDYTGLDPAYLMIEILENRIIEYIDVSITTLKKLKEMGVSIAIDDFGSGYSSLSSLRKLNIDTLKIDASFVQEIHINSDSLAIIETMINLSKGLKLKVIAEGVETEQQKRLLKKKKCYEMQGFYFSKPLTEYELIDFIKGYR